MFNHRAASITRLFLFAALFSLGPVARIKAADSPKLAPADGEALGAAAVRWLETLDAGKYAENFAAASATFRKDLTAESWARNHASMKQQFGAVVSRDDDVSLKTKTTQTDGQDVVTYTLQIKTQFEKKTGLEKLTMEKDSGEWKVADYSIETQL
ncbi:MAG: DUF4019 domain-containing protein [Verrucomicrobiota bacterium]|nr:DUF4019 domain-containing protein [Verrucomicrobiota bacterium]